MRTRISKEELEAKVGCVLAEDDFNLLLTRAARLRKPNGDLLCIYLPGAISPDLRELAYPILKTIRIKSNNRGNASGAPPVHVGRGNYYNPVYSSVIGSFDPQTVRFPYCRLTSWTGNHVDQFHGLFPYFQEVSDLYREHVPDRWKVQNERAEATRREWIITGTPFTTVTVNNTYSTGVHQDDGDLPEGFSCLAVLRRNAYTGGFLVFPEYRVAVDLKDGDLMLMDAHAYHGNTPILCACGETLNGACEECGAERISTVLYYRTKMIRCGSPGEELEKAKARQNRFWKPEEVGGTPL